MEISLSKLTLLLFFTILTLTCGSFDEWENVTLTADKETDGRQTRRQTADRQGDRRQTTVFAKGTKQTFLSPVPFPLSQMEQESGGLFFCNRYSCSYNIEIDIE